MALYEAFIIRFTFILCGFFYYYFLRRKLLDKIFFLVKLQFWEKFLKQI